jgi:AAA domain
MRPHVEDLFVGDIHAARRVADHFGPTPEDVDDGFKMFCGDSGHLGHGRAVLVRTHPKGVASVEFAPECGCAPERVSAHVELLRREMFAPDVEPVSTNGAGPDRPASTITNFTDIKAKPTHWLWHHRIALGRLTALSGRPKIGKGLFYSHLIAQVTRGQVDLDGPRHAIIVTTEDDDGEDLKPRLMAAGADLSRVSTFTMGPRDEPVPFRVPQDADELARRVRERGTALVVIDPLVEFIDGKLDSHKSHDVRHALAAVRRIARDHGCALLVVFHLNKGNSTDPLLRHEGSAAFTQVIRSGLMLGRDPDDPDAGSRRVLAVSASNNAPDGIPSIVYRIEPRIVDGDTGEAIETARIVATGEQSGATAHDLLGARREGDKPRDDLRDDVLGLLGGIRRSGASISKALGRSKNDGTIRRILEDLEADGLAVRDADGWGLSATVCIESGTPGNPPTNRSVEPKEGLPEGVPADGAGNPRTTCSSCAPTGRRARVRGRVTRTTVVSAGAAGESRAASSPASSPRRSTGSCRSTTRGRRRHERPSDRPRGGRPARRLGRDRAPVDAQGRAARGPPAGRRDQVPVRRARGVARGAGDARTRGVVTHPAGRRPLATYRARR